MLLLNNVFQCYFVSLYSAVFTVLPTETLNSNIGSDRCFAQLSWRGRGETCSRAGFLGYPCRLSVSAHCRYLNLYHVCV